MRLLNAISDWPAAGGQYATASSPPGANAPNQPSSTWMATSLVNWECAQVCRPAWQHHLFGKAGLLPQTASCQLLLPK